MSINSYSRYVLQITHTTTEIYKDGEWTAGPDLVSNGLNGCTVNIPGSNFTLQIKSNAFLYDWHSGIWTNLKPYSNAMLYSGRGYGCGFVSNGTNPYVIVAGGSKGRDRSQILPIGGFLATGDPSMVGQWVQGPNLGADMIDTATVGMDDESFIMFSTRVNKEDRVS